MGIETVSPTSPLPDLAPSESAQDARHDSARSQPASTPSASGGARLERLSSLQANRPSSSAGASPVRTPHADALAKLVRSPGTSTPEPIQAAKDIVFTRTIPPTPADVAAVLQRAQELGAMEGELSALQQPPELRPAENAPPASEDAIAKQIDRLESKRDETQRKISDLSQRCKTAFDSMVRHGIALGRKVDLLEQKQAELEKTGPVSLPATQREPAPVQPAAPDRMAALEREIGLLKGSQRKAAEEALKVAGRDKLRELGTWSAAQVGGSLITGALRKLLLGKSGPLSEPLEKSIDAWLDGWMPEPPRARRGRYDTPGELFTKGLGATFDAIQSAARPEASGADAAMALGRLRHHLSSLECKGFGQHENVRLTRHFSTCLVINRLSNKQFFREKTGRAAAYLAPAEGGHDNEKIIVSGLVEQLTLMTAELAKTGRNDGVSFFGESFAGSRLATVKKQVSQLTEHVVANQANLEVVLKAVERQLVEDLKSTAPNEDRHSDTESFGRDVAPHLGPVYGKMIKQLNVEREKLAKQPVRRTAATPETGEASPSQPAGPNRERLETMVTRLRGAVLEYETKHGEAFRHYATLSGEHLGATDALEHIERQLGEARQALQGVREVKRQAAGESAARDQRAASLKHEIDADWRSALGDQALSRLISPTALARVQKMHIGKTPAELRARVRNGNGATRTGTFRSRAELLRTIADIAEHELGKVDSPLRAASKDAFKTIAGGPGRRVNGLLNHGRTIGHGVRASDADNASPARTGTSEYAIDWAEGEGARISHLHPWVSPF